MLLPMTLSCSGLGQSAEEIAARNASLLDQLSDLCRQAALAARKPLLDWLRLLTQVQLTQQDTQGVRQGAQRRAGQGVRQQQAQQGSQQEQQWQQERQRLLREVVRLRAQLQVIIGAGQVCGGRGGGWECHRHRQDVVVGICGRVSLLAHIMVPFAQRWDETS
jgi:hypothetical protein